MPQNCSFIRGSSLIVPRAKPTDHLKRHLDQFSRFCMGPKCYAA